MRDIKSALMKFKLGNCAEAINDLIAIFNKERNPEALYRLAQIYKSSKNIEKSLITIEDALHHKKDEPNYYTLKGNLLYINGNKENAKEEFIKALHLDNEHYNSLLSLGKLYKDDLDFKNSKKYLKKCITSKEKNKKTHFKLLSDIYIRENYTKALEYLKLYKNDIDEIEKNKLKLKYEFYQGNIAIIPAGFRCYTKKIIKKKLGITQESLPFDSGFFPFSSIYKVIKNKVINHKDINLIDNHKVCLKDEKHISDGLENIKFTTSSYHEIHDLIKKNGAKNKYLDKTKGYYTLDCDNGFILAHFNWYDDKKNNLNNDDLININSTLNKRINRMLRKIDIAQTVFFVYSNTQSYNGIMIDEKFESLDYSIIKSEEKRLSRIFNKNCHYISDLEIDKIFNFISQR